MNSRLVAGSAALALALLPLTACAQDKPKAADGSEKVTVVASFYPLEYLATQIGGDHVAVQSLTKPGAEPHDLELSPQQVADVQKAKLVVYEKGLQPAVDEAVDQEAKDHALDVATAVDLNLKFDEALNAEEGEEHEHEDEHAEETAGAPETHAEETAGATGTHAAEEEGEEHEHEMEAGQTDPHFWLDPQRYGKAAEAVAKKLSELDPSHKDTYEANLKTFLGKTNALDEKFTAGLKTCKSKDLVTSHAAFGYLADRYDLKQVAITGISPESEPEPGTLTKVTEYAKKNEVKTIYTETLVDPKVADTVAKETGATTAVLDPIEGLNDKSAAKDYFGIMEANLTTLQKGQQCS